MRTCPDGKLCPNPFNCGTFCSGRPSEPVLPNPPQLVQYAFDPTIMPRLSLLEEQVAELLEQNKKAKKTKRPSVSDILKEAIAISKAQNVADVWTGEMIITITQLKEILKIRD
jgi:hypothetical protein